MYAAPQTFGGLRVFVSPDLPKMQLAPGDYVTPAFRAEIDAWLKYFFGVTNLISDGQFISVLETNTLHMNPRTYAQLKAATIKGGA